MKEAPLIRVAKARTADEASLATLAAFKCWEQGSLSSKWQVWTIDRNGVEVRVWLRQAKTAIIAQVHHDTDAD